MVEAGGPLRPKSPKFPESSLSVKFQKSPIRKKNTTFFSKNMKGTKNLKYISRRKKTESQIRFENDVQIFSEFFFLEYMNGTKFEKYIVRKKKLNHRYVSKIEILSPHPELSLDTCVAFQITPVTGHYRTSICCPIQHVY